jgi:hypothetical protein
LRLANNDALGTSGSVIVNTIPISGNNGAPHVDLTGGVVIPSGVTLSMNSAGAGDWRTSLNVPTGDVNELQGTLIPHGDGNIIVLVGPTAGTSGARLNLSGPISNPGFVLPGTIAFQGFGGGIISGQVNINGELEMNPSSSASIWTFSSPGNQWGTISIETGVVALGTNDGLCTTARIQMPINNGTFDLAGFNQRASLLTNAPGARIGNSSTTANSLLTINGPGQVSVIAGPIVDVLGSGTMTVALTATNSKVLLNGTDTYTGPTLVQNGGTLGGIGSLMSPVTVESGGTLSPGDSIGTLTVANTLTLSGGSTSFFEVDAGTLVHDMVAGLSSVSYGGTLVISNTSSTPFVAGSSFQLFSAASPATGAFTAIVPATPGPGLLWDTSELASRGILKVTAPSLGFSVTGNTLSLNWPKAALGWYAQSNAVNVASPAEWHDIPGSQTGTNLSIPIVPTDPQVYFRLRSP